MASAGGDGGRRDVTVELNIVPFIDLMCVCIIFLLVTAVWTQVSMIQLGTSLYGKQNDTGQVDPPPRADLPLRVDIKADGYYINAGKSVSQIPKLNGDYNFLALVDALKKIKTQYPEKNDATVAIAEELLYNDLIRGMDALLNSGFPEIAVATGDIK